MAPRAWFAWGQATHKAVTRDGCTSVHSDFSHCSLDATEEIMNAGKLAFKHSAHMHCGTCPAPFLQQLC